MFCLRSWLPLLFIPTNASPAFIFLFFLCTYFLNRPCVYCSILLLILFLTSCNWSDRCFFDFSSNWFEPRSPISAGNATTGGGAEGWSNSTMSMYEGMAADQSVLGDFNATVLAMAGNTISGLAKAAADEVSAVGRAEWTGLGLQWLRNLLGKREWRIECMDIYIRL